MDAVQLLREDHERVKNLFHDFEHAPAGQPEIRRGIAERILRELMVHERIEEEIFYPAYRDILGRREQELVEHAKEEHELVDTLVEQLQAIDLDDPNFEALMKVLKENVLHHVEEEETKMFVRARAHMAAELPGLAAEMTEYKQALLRELKDPEIQAQGASAGAGKSPRRT